MKIISFVIPAYNSEKFLEACVGSLAKSSVAEKIEIIIVNDGSTDKTAEIGQSFCEKYPQAVRLINQENRGHGGALNTGCAAAEGKYLKVIDADDTVVTANLPAFIALLEKTESDLLLSHYSTRDVSTGRTAEFRCPTQKGEGDITFEEIMDDWKAFDSTFTFHGITYKTEFYQKYATPLAEKVFYEDHEFSTFPACRAKTISVFDGFVYVYRIGDLSQSVSAENQLKRISHLEVVLFQMAAKFQEASKDMTEAEKTFVIRKTAILLMSFLTTALLVDKNKKQGRKLAEKVIKRLETLFPEVLSAVGKKYKLLRIMNRLGIGKKIFDKIISSRIYKRII